MKRNRFELSCGVVSWAQIFVFCLVGLTGVDGFGQAVETISADQEVRLVLMLVVDQGRADYIDRFETLTTGGFGRLLREGVRFTEAHHQHAITATAPGHATIATGAYPSHSGIVGNLWYEEDGRKAVSCVADPQSPIVGMDSKNQGNASPRNLLVTALQDWIRQADPGARVFSISRKDRAAVLMGGKNPEAAFWYDGSTGDFVSSSYYVTQLPAWVQAFNRRELPAEWFGRLWYPLVDVRSRFSELKIEPTDFGWFQWGFPHAFGTASPSPDAHFFSSFGGTPMMDAYLLEFAKTLIKEEKLGQDFHVDYLSVSLSALDSVGHDYGPNSPELLDEWLRLDKSLGDFFQFLEYHVGLRHVLIVLTSDHGAMELPEYLQALGLPGKRLSDEDIACVQEQGLAFLRHYGAEEDWFLNGFYLNYAALGRNNLLRENAENEAARSLERCSFIRKVWTRTELEKPAGDHFHTMFRNGHCPGRSPDLTIQPEEYYLPQTGTGTSHGTPYRYDTHVPLIIRVPGQPAGRVEDPVATVDIAPTVADLLGIPTPATVDGRSLAPYLPADQQEVSPRQ
jgi:predicted AlkP superfamily pyrophosphatase or phosphodiesterase